MIHKMSVQQGGNDKLLESDNKNCSYNPSCSTTSENEINDQQLFSDK